MAIVLTRKQSLILGVGLLGAFFMVSVFLVAWNSKSRVPSNSSSLTTESVGSAPSAALGTPNGGTFSSGFVLNEFKRNLVRDGRVVWEIVGQRGLYSPGSNVAEISAPQLSLSTKQGEPALITAGRALLQMNGSDLSKADLFDEVVLRYKNDTTLTTSRASYEKASETLTIPVYVEIENASGRTSAQSLTGNLTTQEFTLEGGVHTVLEPQVK